MSKMQKLSEREKFLIVRYAYLIELYLRSGRETPQGKDDHYAAAAYGLVLGVKSVDKAAEGKTFADEEDRDRYYASYLFLHIRSHVIDSINAKKAWSRGGRAVHISTADPLSPNSDADEIGTVEDLLADSTSANGFRAIEDKESAEAILRRCTPHQRDICRYIAYGYNGREIADKMGVTPKHIYRELSKVRKNSADLLPRPPKRKVARSEVGCISNENGRTRVQISIRGKQYRTGFIPREEAEAIRDELLALRDKDPHAALCRIGEINAGIRAKKQYKNPRNIRRYKNFYVVRLTVGGVLESVPMIPTLEEAITVRDELTAARKLGEKGFYAVLGRFREKYGRGK